MVKKQTGKKIGEREKYFEAVGRRKTAIARVRLFKGKGDVLVNNKAPQEYFPVARLLKSVLAPFEDLKLSNTFNIIAHVKGGGIAAQAEAIRHGIARALALAEPELKKRLRHIGFLTRDPRMVERKKYGLKKARRAPQWAKR